MRKRAVGGLRSGLDMGCDFICVCAASAYPPTQIEALIDWWLIPYYPPPSSPPPSRAHTQTIPAEAEYRKVVESIASYRLKTAQEITDVRFCVWLACRVLCVCIMWVGVRGDGSDVLFFCLWLNLPSVLFSPESGD